MGTSRKTPPGGPNPATPPAIPNNAIGLFQPGHARAGQQAQRAANPNSGPHVEEAIGMQKSAEGAQRPHANTHYGTFSVPGRAGYTPEQMGGCTNCGPMTQERGGGFDVYRGQRTQTQLDDARRRQDRKLPDVPTDNTGGFVNFSADNVPAAWQ